MVKKKVNKRKPGTRKDASQLNLIVKKLNNIEITLQQVTKEEKKIEREEKIAMFVGRIAAILYLINATLVFTLFFNILTRPKRK